LLVLLTTLFVFCSGRIRDVAPKRPSVRHQAMESVAISGVLQVAIAEEFDKNIHHQFFYVVTKEKETFYLEFHNDSEISEAQTYASQEVEITGKFTGEENAYFGDTKHDYLEVIFMKRIQLICDH
jgi:hypothetical protein